MSGRFIQKLKNLRRWQWLVLAAFLFAVAFTAFYSYRTYERAAFWREHRDEPIAGWMRVGFVANSYHVPLPELNKAIGLPPELRDRRPLKKIAEDQGRPFEELKAELERAIAEFRKAHPPPPGGRP
ncbi:MAG: hypothetical protein QUS14_14615 [Pyrinomonadaceae bacterium]|nr:hypothetical protein [Pyrinomonadaceae bacterium]